MQALGSVSCQCEDPYPVRGDHSQFRLGSLTLRGRRRQVDIGPPQL